ncbi:hypothetical protein DFH09DRAFT_163095 [Mycena vulgaris]|nr:hypothetical protein DFH09DRAFT_163095 [Mycena vulgaris]
MCARSRLAPPAPRSRSLICRCVAPSSRQSALPRRLFHPEASPASILPSLSFHIHLNIPVASSSNSNYTHCQCDPLASTAANILYLQTFATLCTTRALTPACFDCLVFHLLQGRAAASSMRASDHAIILPLHSRFHVLGRRRQSSLRRSIAYDMRRDYQPHRLLLWTVYSTIAPRTRRRASTHPPHSAECAARLRRRVPDAVRSTPCGRTP